MTCLHNSRLFRPVALLAAAAGLVLVATAGAQAFTFNDQSGDSANSSARFADPVERAKSRMNNDSSSDKPVIRSGPTLQFGGRESFDQRNNGDRYFNPNYIMGK